MFVGGFGDLFALYFVLLVVFHTHIYIGLSVEPQWSLCGIVRGVCEYVSVCRPKVRNTWGDAVYFVFSRVPDAGSFALLLSDLVTRIPWYKLGLPKSLNIRISLHAAPVHPVVDPITQTKAS
jgi:hypothetical protein